MKDSYIISKMNEYMYKLSEKLGAWLKCELPRITDNWWDDMVISVLSPLQRKQVISDGISDISGLDLAELLRVFDKNWFVITGSSRMFINNQTRRYIRQMQEARNSWAHITPNTISKEKVRNDVGVIIELMGAFNARPFETRDMEGFIFDVEEDREILEDTPKKEAKTVSDSGKMTGEIIVGSVVTLVSDESRLGAVIEVSGDKFSVLIDGAVQSFYREQIKLKGGESAVDSLSLDHVKAALTAYQINNPGSSNLYSLNSARIDFVPYQFRPALKLIKADSPRLLIADDVGVGKTIEAGLILKELEARSSVESVLIICPRPLVSERKWELEMKRFDEDFTQMDGRMFAEAILEMDRDGEWPDRHKKTIIPYSLFSEDAIMGKQSTSGKKNKSLGLSELDPLPRFDLVIVDDGRDIIGTNQKKPSKIKGLQMI